MRVVEEQREGAAGSSKSAEFGDEIGIGPFMDNHHISIRNGGGVIEIRVVGADVEFRKTLVEVCESRLALLATEIDAAPSLRRLQRLHLMPAGAQLSENAPLEMGVPVIPVGHEGMGIENKFHALGRVSRGSGDFGQHL